MTPARPGSTRVLLVDDHRLLAQSLALALQAEGLAAEIADLTDREQLIEHVRRTRPDVVLLDLDLGGIGDGASLVRPFGETGARVLVVSGCTDPCWRGAALEEGAAGVLDKSGPFDVLLTGVLAAGRGDDVMAPHARQRLVDERRRMVDDRCRSQLPFQRLTEREQQVLCALGEGTSVREIAQAWFVSEATVRSQVRGVLIKLGVKSQLEAVAHARRAGWFAADARRTA